jgi:hypothetical protein
MNGSLLEESIKNLNSLGHEVISLQKENSLLAIERLKEAKRGFFSKESIGFELTITAGSVVKSSILL